jgi:hypothetical protein
VIIERGGDRMYEELIPAIATATRIVCVRPEARAAAATADAADAEIFWLLAESAGESGVAGVLRLGSSMIRDLAASAGPLADGIISNSSRRLMAHVRAGDADAAEREVEKLLRCLHVMWRLARADKHAALTPDDWLPEGGCRDGGGLAARQRSQEDDPARTMVNLASTCALTVCLTGSRSRLGSSGAMLAAAARMA